MKQIVRGILEKLIYVIVMVAIVGMIIIFRVWDNGPVKLLILAIPFLIIVICLFIGVKRDEKKEKEYRNKYVTEVIINDKVFGEMKFEKDSNKNELSCKNFKVLFGQYNPTVHIQDYDENNNELYFRSLEYIYGKQQEIIETLFEGFLEAYSNSKEVTPDTLRENFAIEKITICKCDEYFLEGAYFIKDAEAFEIDAGEWVIAVCGNPNKNKLYGNYYSSKYPVAYMDCSTKQMYYVLEE